MNVEELDIPPVIVRHLHGAGITRVDQVVRLTRPEIRRFHGMGEKVTDRLEAALTKVGKRLKPE